MHAEVAGLHDSMESLARNQCLNKHTQLHAMREQASTGRKGMCGASAHYPAHIPRYPNRQLPQAIRPFADHLERVIVHADVHHIQAPQGAAPATDQVGTEASGEHGSITLAPDGRDSSGAAAKTEKRSLQGATGTTVHPGYHM